MNPRIKLIPRAQFERLSATATRDELLQVLSEYVAKKPGRPATGQRSNAEYIRRSRAKKKAESGDT